LQNGELSEETHTEPVTPYGLAKDVLRRELQMLQKEHPFVLQWVRLFYIYESPHGILSQLDVAIDSGEKVFDMSGGEQLRDYLSVVKIAEYLVDLIEHPECSGIINCCSGKPVSIRSLVEQRMREQKSDIKLNFGCYPYLSYEPMWFWGNNKKLQDGIHV
jgi:dTDP-6-deoxy-L-talose 4-dehydrogenase (NAD+)